MRWLVALVSLAVPSTGLSGFVHALDYRKPVRERDLHMPEPPEPFFTVYPVYGRRACIARLRRRYPPVPAGIRAQFCDCVVRSLPPGSVSQPRVDAATARCGGDPLAMRPRISPRPILPMQSYISAYDYPPGALREQRQGAVRIWLGVGPNGRVTDCRVTVSSGSAALDQATCRRMRSSARFEPARDARGVIASVYRATIRWRLSADD